MKEVEEIIKEVIDSAFVLIDKCFMYNNEDKETSNPIKAGSSLLFPRYGKCEEIQEKENKDLYRISEQEMKMAFIQAFTQNARVKEKGYCYSVETPTEEKFRFSSKAGVEFPHMDNEKGESARMDLCIHGTAGNRIALIEFKAGSHPAFNFIKDFLKLAIESKIIAKKRNEPVIPCFFIHLDEGKMEKDIIIKGIQEKIDRALKPVSDNGYNEYVDKFKESIKNVNLYYYYHGLINKSTENKSVHEIVR